MSAATRSLTLVGALLCAFLAIFGGDPIIPDEWCPPLRSPVRVRLAPVGANASSARDVELATRWLPPFRASLGTELLPFIGDARGDSRPAVSGGTAWDADGNVVRCASSLSADGRTLVYAAAASQHWQWPPEWVGYTRTLQLPTDGAIVGRLEAEHPGALAPFYVLAPKAKAEDERLAQSAAAAQSGGTDDDQQAAARRATLTTLSASPPLFRVSGLFSDAELDALHEAARPSLKPSKLAVEGATDGDRTQRRVDSRRVSSESWLHGHNDPRLTQLEVRRAQRRLAALLRLPLPSLTRGVEPLLVVQYADGQFYEPHHDFFAAAPPSAARRGRVDIPVRDGRYAPPDGTNRFATVLLDLSDGDDAAGGHTIFPFATAPNATALDGIAMAGAAGAPGCDFPELQQRRGLMVRPRKGDALVFYPQLPGGALDGRTRHGSCPVRRRGGHKAVAHAWFWNRHVIYGASA